MGESFSPLNVTVAFIFSPDAFLAHKSNVFLLPRGVVLSESVVLSVGPAAAKTRDDGRISKKHIKKQIRALLVLFLSVVYTSLAK